MSLQAILGGVSLASSLFSPKNSQYAAQAAYDQQQGQHYLNNLGTLNETYGTEATNANNQYNADNGDYRTALSNLADYYKTNPYTDAYSQQMLAQSNAGQYADQAQASANLLSSAAQRGVADSSSTTGGLAGIQTGYQGGLAQQRNSLALQAIQDQQNRRQALASLYGGAASNDYGKAQNAYGMQGETSQNLASTYNGLFNQNTARNAAYQQQRANGILGGASAIGNYFGGGGTLAGIGSLFGKGGASSPP